MITNVIEARSCNKDVEGGLPKSTESNAGRYTLMYIFSMAYELEAHQPNALLIRRRIVGEDQRTLAHEDAENPGREADTEQIG